MSKIIGQDKLIKEVNKILQIFINSNCKIRPHFILTGESGSGKSFTIKQLCELNEINFLEINAAQITKEGVSGNSLSKILSPLINYTKVPTVIFVDEFDKLFINGNSNSQIASEFNKLGIDKSRLNIIVTHMVNPRGIENLSNNFSHVWFTNSYKDWNNLPDNVTMEKIK